MANYWERRKDMQRDWKKYSHTPINSRLKYASIGFISLVAIAMVTLLIITVATDGESYVPTELVFRIFAGVCASIGAILLMILSYRIYSASLRERWTKNN